MSATLTIANRELRAYFATPVATVFIVIFLVLQGALTFNLGQFFAIWGQPLSASNVAGFTGTVTAYVDSTLYTGDLAAIDFQEHRQITLIVGTVPDTIPLYAFPADY